MIRVKVCGITNLDDALVAAAAGADALGFNFWAGSKRFVEPEEAATIIQHLPPFVTPVGVFVDEKPERVENIAQRAGVRGLQFHGEESPDEVGKFAESGFTLIKAFRVGRRFQAQQLRRYSSADAFLLDAEVKGQRGGTGESFDWKRARAANRYGRVLLAGGLTVENLAEAIRQTQPYGVDVCTGVERKPGVKDHDLLRAFLQQAKRAIES